MARQTDRRRRARLLKNVQIAILCLIAVGFAALLASRPNTGGRLMTYSWLILGLIVVMSVALALNLKGRFGFSAALTVGVLMVPPWLSLAFDPRVPQGDFVPMAYVVLPVMIAAMFMGIRTVVTVAAVQDIGVFVLAAASPSTGFNWASLLTLIVIIEVISTLYCLITREDLNQIDLDVESLHAKQADLLYASTHDLLTGVYNRAYLAQQFPREISLASRNGRPFSIVMADIDRFKTINDTLGHAQGDEALRQVAQHLERMTRVSDSVCRLGGDEFVLLLPDTDSLGAMTIAELVRTAMPGAGDSGTEGPTLTVSLGVATYRSHGSSPDEMLASADASLYAAKHSGRNRIGVPGGGRMFQAPIPLSGRGVRQPPRPGRPAS